MLGKRTKVVTETTVSCFVYFWRMKLRLLISKKVFYSQPRLKNRFADGSEKWGRCRIRISLWVRNWYWQFTCTCVANMPFINPVNLILFWGKTESRTFLVLPNLLFMKPDMLMGSWWLLKSNFMLSRDKREIKGFFVPSLIQGNGFWRNPDSLLIFWVKISQVARTFEKDSFFNIRRWWIHFLTSPDYWRKNEIMTRLTYLLLGDFHNLLILI